jgi:hypothetical protein
MLRDHLSSLSAALQAFSRSATAAATAPGPGREEGASGVDARGAGDAGGAGVEEDHCAGGGADRGGEPKLTERRSGDAPPMGLIGGLHAFPASAAADVRGGEGSRPSSALFVGRGAIKCAAGFQGCAA